MLAIREINKLYEEIESAGKVMIGKAIRIGELLTEQKASLGHGEWIPWIEDSLPFGRKQAAAYMRVFSNKGELANVTSGLHLTDAIASLAEPKAQIPRISTTPAEIQPGQFRTIIIDPPWPYGTQYDAENRRVASPYKEMTLEAIADTEFPFADDCVLWFWTTHKFLPASFKMLEQWGFAYKATMVWNKENIGIGYWLRMQCEFCLLAIKGNPVWNATDIRDIITEARREHSRKPEAFYETVLKHSPRPIGEAFGRQRRDGITIVTGNEADKFERNSG